MLANDASLLAEIRAAIDNKTKPVGSLGRLEEVAFQVARIQGTVSPELRKPTLMVFAGDHGITDEGVSLYPREVTWQMVHNYLAGGAAINVFARQHQMELVVVDAGVDHDFGQLPGLHNRKQGMASANFRYGAALTEAQLDACLREGAALVDATADGGCNVVGFGEMGIGNTSAAAVLMSALCKLPIERCTGRGTGLNDEALAHKTKVLGEAMALHGAIRDTRTLLRTYAGFEMAMMCGAMLQAYRRGMLLLIDGFIVTSVLLVAAALEPQLLDHCLVAHVSDEHGHGAMLQHLGLKPLLQLDMRLGEGTGVALAYPLVVSAVNFLNEMASFASAGVASSDG